MAIGTELNFFSSWFVCPKLTWLAFAFALSSSGCRGLVPDDVDDAAVPCPSSREIRNYGAPGRRGFGNALGPMW
jgi:hypothetical protein